LVLSQQQQKIYEATGAEVPLQMQVLSDNMWKGITPRSMWAKGERVYKGLGLTRTEMEIQFTIELLEQAGYSRKNKSEIRPLSTNKPHEAVQMTNTNYTYAEEASYAKNKRMFDGLGLTKTEAMTALGTTGPREKGAQLTGTDAANALYKKLGLKESEYPEA
jgi:hypothetical protein